MRQIASPQRILVVEDDVDNGQLFVDLLELSGYEVDLVSSGRAAVQAMRTKPEAFAAVILDFDLRDMSGRQVLAATDGYRANLPVVLVSANRDVPALAHELAVACFVPKPFHPDRLLAQLATCIAAT